MNDLDAVNFEEFFTKDNVERIRNKQGVRKKTKIGCVQDGCKANLFFAFFFIGKSNNYIASEYIIYVKAVGVLISMKIFQALFEIK